MLVFDEDRYEKCLRQVNCFNPRNPLDFSLGPTEIPTGYRKTYRYRHLLFIVMRQLGFSVYCVNDVYWLDPEQVEIAMTFIETLPPGTKIE